eukprot:476051-Rhodomonas_salina.1
MQCNVKAKSGGRGADVAGTAAVERAGARQRLVLPHAAAGLGPTCRYPRRLREQRAARQNRAVWRVVEAERRRLALRAARHRRRGRR